MALSLADKAELLAELEENLYKGIRKIKFRDKELTYHSLAEMQSLRSQLRRELGLSPKVLRVAAKFDKGLC